MALTLEERGILGEGMSFSSSEREAADNIETHFHISGNVGQGVFAGNIAQSTIEQTASSVSKHDFESLRKRLAEIGVDSDDVDQLEIAIEDDGDFIPTESKQYGKSVRAWLGGILVCAATKVSVDMLTLALDSFFGLP